MSSDEFWKYFEDVPVEEILPIQSNETNIEEFISLPVTERRKYDQVSDKTKFMMRIISKHIVSYAFL